MSHMKKVISTILFLVFGSFTLISVQAQEAKTLFVNMPESLSPLLTAVNRADCIDFIESKMKAQVDNRFGKKSEMTDLSKDYIRIQMSPETTWQMKVLAVNDSTNVICTVATACGPVCDSNVRFYNTKWQELPLATYLTVPVMDDFLEVPDTTQTDEFNNARLHADMQLMKADLSKSDGTLIFTFTTPEYLEKETADKLKPFIRRPFIFMWKEKTGRFVPVPRFVEGSQS